MGNMCDKQRWQWTAYLIYSIFFPTLGVFAKVSQEGAFALGVAYFMAMWWTSETL